MWRLLSDPFSFVLLEIEVKWSKKKNNKYCIIKPGPFVNSWIVKIVDLCQELNLVFLLVLRSQFSLGHTVLHRLETLQSQWELLFFMCLVCIFFCLVGTTQDPLLKGVRHIWKKSICLLGSLLQNKSTKLLCIITNGHQKEWPLGLLLCFIQPQKKGLFTEFFCKDLILVKNSVTKSKFKFKILVV